MITKALPDFKDYTFTIVTAMKNEGPYILDWISYHIAIGFTHFVILTNDCSDKTDNICRNLEKLGIVTHVNNTPPYPRGIQKTAWKRAGRVEAVEKAKWLMSLDVDEYLYLEQGDGSLDALFSQFETQPTAISFPWLFYGDNDVRELKDEPVWQQFTRSAHPFQARPFQIRGLKTLYKNLDGSEIGTHRPKFKLLPDDVLWVTADGVPMNYMWRKPYWCVWDDGMGFGSTLGRVCHFAIRSRQAYFLKILRGFVNRTEKGPRADESATTYWNMFNWNIEENNMMRDRGCVSEPIREQLFANAKLADLHGKSFAIHQQHVKLALENPEYSEEFGVLLNSQMRTNLSADDPVLKDGTFPNLTYPPDYLQQRAMDSTIKQEIINAHYQKFTNFI